MITPLNSQIYSPLTGYIPIKIQSAALKCNLGSPDTEVTLVGIVPQSSTTLLATLIEEPISLTTSPSSTTTMFPFPTWLIDFSIEETVSTTFSGYRVTLSMIGR